MGQVLTSQSFIIQRADNLAAEGATYFACTHTRHLEGQIRAVFSSSSGLAGENNRSSLAPRDLSPPLSSHGFLVIFPLQDIKKILEIICSISRKYTPPRPSHATHASHPPSTAETSPAARRRTPSPPCGASCARPGRTAAESAPAARWESHRRRRPGRRPSPARPPRYA